MITYNADSFSLFSIVTNNAGASEELDDRIENENILETQKRRDYVSSRLGDGPQPKLEVLEYKVSVLNLFSMCYFHFRFCRTVFP